jgi:hypothetical protein
MKEKLEQSFGAAQRPDPTQVAAEVKQIIQEDLLAHNIIQPVLATPAPGAATSAAEGAGAASLADGAGAVSTTRPAGAAAAPALLPQLLPRNRLKAAAAALDQLD